jgi:hypothetical protein
MKTKHNAMTLSECLQTVAYVGDNYANTLEMDAPQSAVDVLDDLDLISSTLGLQNLADVGAVAKLTGAARFMRLSFSRFSLGSEDADLLERVASNLTDLMASSENL